MCVYIFLIINLFLHIHWKRKELAYAVKEANTFQHLQNESSNWCFPLSLQVKAGQRSRCFSSNPKGVGECMAQVTSSDKKIFSYLKMWGVPAFFFYLPLQLIGWRSLCFIQSTNSNIKYYLKTSHSHTQNNV